MCLYYSAIILDLRVACMECLDQPYYIKNWIFNLWFLSSAFWPPNLPKSENFRTLIGNSIVLVVFKFRRTLKNLLEFLSKKISYFFGKPNKLLFLVSKVVFKWDSCNASWPHHWSGGLPGRASFIDLSLGTFLRDIKLSKINTLQEFENFLLNLKTVLR